MKTAIVIGAGPAGLAVGAALKAKGLDVTLLEKGDHVAKRWHDHYDRLHLHTPAKTSGLPGMDYPASAGKYPSRADVIAYMEAYASRFKLTPRFGVEVRDVARDGAAWKVTHSGGEDHADVVVFATGMADRPLVPDFDGINAFGGEILHSSEYRNAGQIAGRRALVIGFGNSGGEIALDLAEAGKAVTLAVRSPVQILPKEILGVPITSFGLLQKLFDYRTVDAINAPLLRLVLGDFTRFGLRRADRGPVAMIKELGRVPLIDIGTLAAIRAGRIKVVDGVSKMHAQGVQFENGMDIEFDAIVMATGYVPRLAEILSSVEGVLDARGRPLVSGDVTAADGLFFCSYKPTPNGQLRQTGTEALQIAEAVSI